jgi:hypothetical protein
MTYFKVLIITILFSTYSTNTYCQIDTSEVNDDKDTTAQVVQINKIIPHKRGVYKSYDEYVSNSPSVDAEFTLTPLHISKKNTLIAEADVDFKGKRPKKIWGVSDGENVYIKVMVGNFFKNHYFKLQCDGPSPYIYLVENPIFLPAGLGVAVMASAAATSAVLPPFVTLSIVRDKTNYFKPVLMATNNRVKSYIKFYPDLLEAYENEPKHNKTIKAKYLTEYNKRKLEK